MRRELENILLLVDELEAKGVPKAKIIDIILDEKADRQNERPGEKQ